MSSKIAGSNLGWWDLVVILFYFIFVIVVGIWSSRQNKTQNISGYFLASRNMHWIPVGASLFASCIGSGHFIGLAGSAAASGVAVAGFELGAVFILMMLGWFFCPVYLSSGIYTMPEYLRERFGGQRIRIYLAFLSLILYIFTKISAELFAGALFIQRTLNQNTERWLYISILILLAIAALFTIFGGLTAVIWTDFVQTILMVLGAFILMGMTFNKIGGFNSIVTDYPYAIAQNRSKEDSCSIPPADYLNLLRTIEPGKSDFPWTGIVFGLTINALWYWCTDQVIVQRTLASKNYTHAKAGCIFASYIKILPLWLMIFPGMAARIIFPETVGCADPDVCDKICGSRGGCTNIAYIELVNKILPEGLTGMMLAVMMAALMSSLTSIFNSASTIFTIDVWTRFRKNPSDIELQIIGKLSVVVLVAISVIWIPVIRDNVGSKLFDYIQSITAFLAPSVCAIFLLAIFWPRTNEQGAFWGLMLGLLVGMIRFILEFSFPAPLCGSGEIDTRPDFIIATIGRVHYLHFSCLLFLFAGLIAICISLMTKPIPEECLYRLTFWSRHRTEVRKNVDEYFLKLNGFNNDVKSSAQQSAHPNINNQLHIESPHALQTDSWKMLLLYKFCGVSKKTLEESRQEPPQISEEVKAKDAAEFLKEDPFWKRVVDCNAVICICVTIFIWGYFA